jgi:FixJ family two-component response regulator
MPILFITGQGDVPTSVRAMKAGAAEFLTKPFSHDVLIAGVRRAIERSRIALDLKVELTALRSRYSTLTSREREVMALATEGLLNKQIAYELGLSEVTVKVHRGRAMRKMKASSLAALVRMAANLGVEPFPKEARLR